MKILRLVSSKLNCEFNEYLKEDLIIKPNSKICMANTSFILQYPSLTIDGTNNIIQYNCGSGLRTCILQEKIYSGTESGGLVLLQDIETALNNQLRLTGKEFGGGYQVTKKNGIIDIEYSIRNLSQYYDGDFNVPANISISGQDGDQYRQINRNSLTASSDDSSRIVLLDYLTRGSGVFRIKLGVLTNNNSLINGLSLILSKSGNSGIINGGATLTDEIKPFGVHIVPDTVSTFKYMYSDGDGTLKDPDIIIRPVGQGLDVDGNPNANNDVLEINIQEGKINGTIYQNAGGSTVTTLFSVDIEPQQTYTPALIMRGGSAECTIYNPQYTDRGSSINKKSYIDINLQSQLAIPVPPSDRLSNHSIDFSQSTNVAQFLGFEIDSITNSYIYSRPNYRSTANYLANKNFTASNADSFIVLFDNAMIDSYDSYLKSRSNIIKVFVNPSTITDNREVNYESNTLDFIDIRNQEEISLRNIKCRILYSDYIKDENE